MDPSVRTAVNTNTKLIMKHQLLISAILLSGATSMWAQSAFDDDIYYNPDKAKTATNTKKQTKNKKQSNYIADMADMDVDAYNRRGEAYYTTSIDTIGTGVETGEDFVYTQQIQKYYNPTIVVDNADVLGDVLSNAYGNVEIVIDNGVPVFGPYSYTAYGWPYSSWWTSPTWRFNYGLWGWSVGFYDPWYSWGWGPSWTWGPSWGYGPAWGPSWGWVPGWGWGPAWGPGYVPGGWGPQPPMASWRPNGNRPAGARPGWSNNTRPGGNVAHRNPSGRRPGTMAGRPVGGSTRPGNSGVTNNNGRWEYNTTATTGHRQPGTGVVNSGSGQRNPSSTTTVRGNNRNSNVNSNNTNYNRNSNYNRNNSSTTQRNNSGNYNPSRSSGGGFGGGRSTGGGHSSGGGRGGRR